MRNPNGPSIEQLDDWNDIAAEQEAKRKELERIFDLFKNKDHWKNPIDSYCTSDEVKLVAEAIEFFTATKAHFDYIGQVGEDWQYATRFKIGDHILKFRADGR